MGTKSKWKNGILRFYNNAVVEENVVVTTAAGALLGYGLSVISSTINGTYTLGAPVAGVVKDIVVGHNLASDSTFVATVRFSTVDGQVTAHTPATTGVFNGLILTPTSAYPAMVSLRGASTTKWVITAAGGVGTTAMAGSVIRSSAI